MLLVVRRDVSPGNVMEVDGRGLLIDFHVAIIGTGSQAGHIITGTTNYQALGLHSGMFHGGVCSHCLAFDLESLFYTILYTSLPGKVPWGNCLSERTLGAEKYAAMVIRARWEATLGMCAELLRPLVRGLHDVFFVSTVEGSDSFLYKRGTVTLEQFLEACEPFVAAV